MKKIDLFIDGRIKKSYSRIYKSKLLASLKLVRSIYKTKKEIEILGLVKEIRYCAHLGSGIKLNSKVFYVGKGLLERGAIRFQLKFNKRLEFSNEEIIRLQKWLKTPYYYQIRQKERNW